MRWHDAGRWGGAGRTVGDRHRGARGGRPLFPPFPRRLCAPYEKTTATVRVAPCCESRSNGPRIVRVT
eukprot:4030992-Prymnesium_polylepis.1